VDQEQQQALTAAQQEVARACAAQILADGITTLTHRMDAFEKERALSQKRAEAEAQRRDRERVQSYIDHLPDPDDPYTLDPKEREATDQDPEGSDPTDIIPTDEDPAPQDPDLMGAVYDPEPSPAPGSRLYPPRPGIPQPTAISLNEA
jgi:hypothetical protein